jgi:hypothetical protein
MFKGAVTLKTCDSVPLKIAVLNNYIFSPNITRTINTSSMRLAGHLKCIRDEKFLKHFGSNVLSLLSES